VSPVKTAEPIKMPFGLRTQVGPGNHVLDESPEMLRDVATATNFGTKIAITDFVRTIATRQMVMSGRLIGCRYCRYPALRPKGRCHGNHFLAFDGL